MIYFDFLKVNEYFHSINIGQSMVQYVYPLFVRLHPCIEHVCRHPCITHVCSRGCIVHVEYRGYHPNIQKLSNEKSVFYEGGIVQFNGGGTTHKK